MVLGPQIQLKIFHNAGYKTSICLIFKQLYCEVTFWWIHPDWMPGADQSHSVTALHRWTGGRKKKNLMSWDKGRKRSLTNDHNGQNWGKIILIYWQSSQSKIMRNKTQSYTIFPSPLPYSDFSPGFSTSSQRCCRGNGDAGIWLLSVHHVLSLRLLPPQQRAPHTPPLLQSGVPPIGDCELHKLLPLESFP